MATLSSPRTGPPDGWIFFQPETGSRFEAMIGPELVDLVVAHRQWKNLERQSPEEVWTDIQRQICERLPPGHCSAEPGEDYQPFTDLARGMTTEMVMNASKAAFAVIQNGGLVPKAESERRAEICRRCQFNRPSPCIACSPMFAVMDALIPKDRQEPGLSACGICGCSLRAAVLTPIVKDRHRYPSYCWKSEESCVSEAGSGNSVSDGEENGEKVVG
jgi:hypothetical protein